MVARSLVFAWDFVDVASTDLGAQRITHQNVIDAQALVFAKRQVAVIPPTPALGGLVE
jgi:hypothetical protein